MTERERLSTRLVHGPRLKQQFTRAMGWLGRISPELSFSLWTCFRGLAFPLRPLAASHSPRLRDDIYAYAGLFREASRNFANTVSPFQSETNWPRGRVFNNLFESVDAELYYSMIRFFKPSQIVEVGAGNSTWFARDALRANGYGKLLAIDPLPRLALPGQCQIVKRHLEEIDLTFFQRLGENDILFIDASHTKQEALYETENIYPLLHRNVIIHHHDISFPYVAFASVCRDLGENSEQKVILDFLRSHPQAYEVFTGSAYVGYEHPRMLQQLVPSSEYAQRWNQSSLWIKKIED